MEKKTELTEAEAYAAEQAAIRANLRRDLLFWVTISAYFVMFMILLSVICVVNMVENNHSIWSSLVFITFLAGIPITMISTRASVKIFTAYLEHIIETPRHLFHQPPLESGSE